MNVSKKSYSVFAIFFIVIFIGCFIGGFFFGKGRTDNEVIETQETIDKLTGNIIGFKTTIKSTIAELENLKRRKFKDEETIRNIQFSNTQLEDSNREFTELIEKQRKLIIKLGESNISIGESSSTITDGLGEVIKAIDNLIQELQEEDD